MGLAQVGDGLAQRRSRPGGAATGPASRAGGAGPFGCRSPRGRWRRWVRLTRHACEADAWSTHSCGFVLDRCSADEQGAMQRPCGAGGQQRGAGLEAASDLEGGVEGNRSRRRGGLGPHRRRPAVSAACTGLHGAFMVARSPADERESLRERRDRGGRRKKEGRSSVRGAGSRREAPSSFRPGRGGAA